MIKGTTRATRLLTAVRKVRPGIVLVDHVTSVEGCSIAQYDEQGHRCRCP